MNISSFRWGSLKTQITVYTLGIFLLGIASLAYLVTSMLREDLQRVLGDQQLANASLVAAYINLDLISRTQALETVAKALRPLESICY